MNNKFPKSEKLKSAKAISLLFTEGKTYTSSPLKVFYTVSKNPPLSENQSALKAAFSVPKRNFKSAVSRNRIKRQMRETYRLNKEIMVVNDHIQINFLFLFLGKKSVPYPELQKAMIRIIKYLNKQIVS